MSVDSILELARPAVRELRQGIRRRIRADRRPITGIPAAISFTFDDVPLSATTHGLRALERLGAPATFYVATSLCGQDSAEYGAMCDLDDLRMLAAAGHHLGAHSHTHAHLERGGEGALREDSLHNRAILEDLIGQSVDDFAYPYGEYTFRAKTELGSVFRSLRTVEPGVNQGSVDLRLLKSESLERKHFSLERVERSVEQCANEGGWLIFFTHDVSDEPSEYGTTTAGLGEVARIVEAAGVPVHDVATARTHLFDSMPLAS